MFNSNTDYNICTPVVFRLYFGRSESLRFHFPLKLIIYFDNVRHVDISIYGGKKNIDIYISGNVQQHIVLGRTYSEFAL